MDSLTTDADAKIRWSFTLELRGGVFGFLIPPSQIVPAGEETFAGLLSLADFVTKVPFALLVFFWEATGS